MKRRGCTGRRAVLEECRRRLLLGERCSADTSSNSFSSCCIYAFHFHVLMRSLVVLLLPSVQQLASWGAERTSAIVMARHVRVRRQRVTPAWTGVLLSDPPQLFPSLLGTGNRSNKFLFYSSILIQGALRAKNV